MRDYTFYSAILGLSSDWLIQDVTVDKSSGEIELHIRSRRGSSFSCPSCGALKAPSGTCKDRWLHENRLNFRFYISALIPVITCERCGEMKTAIPWRKTRSTVEEQELVDSPGNAEACPNSLF